MGKSQPPHHDLIVKHITWPYSYLISGGVLIICLMCLCFSPFSQVFVDFDNFFLRLFLFYIWICLSYHVGRCGGLGWRGGVGCEKSVEVASNVDAAVMTGHEDDSVMMLGCWRFEDDSGDDVRVLMIWGWNNTVMMLGPVEDWRMKWHGDDVRVLRIWGWNDTVMMLGCWGFEDDMLPWPC